MSEPRLEIYHGDGIEMLCQIEEPCIIVTDPPFNIGYHYDGYSDKIPESEYWNTMGALISMLDGCVMIHYPEALHKVSHAAEQFPNRVVSWVYPSNTRRQHRDIAFYGVAKPDFRKVRQPYKNPNDKRIKKLIANGSKGAPIYDWWEINQVKNVNKEKTDHPCQMPLEVMKRIIGILPEGYAIADPYGGSGTTMVAAISQGRNCYVADINQKYCEIMESRIPEAFERGE